jgi:CubicO group peptidase (beta-lactamase class C family)
MFLDAHRRRVRPNFEVLWLFLCAVVLAFPARTLAGAPGLDRAALDRYVAEQVQQRGLVGVSVAVVDHGETVLLKGYGKSS